MSLCLFAIVCYRLIVVYQPLIQHKLHGNLVTYKNVTIITPDDWILYKKTPDEYTFLYLNGAILTIGKIGASKENLEKASEVYKRVLYIDGQKAFWERYDVSEGNEENKIFEYFVIPSEDLSITCSGKIEDISACRNILANIYFRTEIELSEAENSEVEYYSRLVERQKEMIQQEILKQGDVIAENIILANDFLDWLRQQKVVEVGHIPKIPSRTAASMTIKDAEVVFIGVVDGYYPTVGLAYDETGKRIAYNYAVDLLDPEEAWRDALKLMIIEGCSDIFTSVGLAHTKRISDAFFLQKDEARILFVLAHEAITYQFHSLYCIDEPVGMVIPVYLVQKYVREKKAEPGSDPAWAKVEEEITTYLDSYSRNANEFTALYSQLQKNEGDRLIISKYLRNNYLDAYDDSGNSDYELSGKLLRISLEPARDDKIGWSHIASEYPYFAHYESVRKIVEDALVHHDGDIISVCRNYTAMITPKDKAYPSTEAGEMAVLEKLKEALFK